MQSILLLLLFASASFQDPNPDLKRFCLSPYIDSPSETGSHLDRIVGDNCEQSFPYVATEEQQDLFCRSALPYDSEVIERSQTSFRCRWSASNACPKETITLYDKCYALARGRNCSQGFETAKPSNIDDIRWISTQFRPYEIVKVDSSRGIVRKIIQKASYRRGIFEENPTEEGQELIMITSRMSISGFYPGQFIYSSDALYDYSQLPLLCVQKAMTLDSNPRKIPYVPEKPQKPDPSVENGAAHLHVKIEGGFAFITRNSYLPKLFESGNVDVNHFHEICRNICEGCYAATYESFAKHKLPHGRYHVPVSREQRSDPKLRDLENEEFYEGNKKMFNAKINVENSGTHIPKEEHWAPRAPYMSNADMERLSVHLIQNDAGKFYVDAPVYDYRPVMCIMGAPLPPPLQTGRCYKNSEWDGKKCKCKAKYRDISEVPYISMYARRKGYHKKGIICIPDEYCWSVPTDTNTYKVVAFVFEPYSPETYGNAITVVKDFVWSIRNELKGAALFFKSVIPYESGWHLRYGTSNEDISTGLTVIPEGISNGQVPTLTSISDVMWHKAFRNRKSEKKLMYVFFANAAADAEEMMSVFANEKEHFGWTVIGLFMPASYRQRGTDLYDIIPGDAFAIEDFKWRAKNQLRTKGAYRKCRQYVEADAEDAMKPS